MAHWAKVIAILEMPNLINVHTLRNFIGLCNYYMFYVHDFSIIVHPFNALLKRRMLFGHGVKRLKKLSTHSRKKLSEFPILKIPNFSKVFILHTNWSALGIGAILGQLDEEDKEYIIAYASRSNNKVESNYSSYEGECLVVV